MKKEYKITQKKQELGTNSGYGKKTSTKEKTT